MTDSPTLGSLIDRLQTEKPSRELDALVGAIAVKIITEATPGNGGLAVGAHYIYEGWEDGSVNTYIHTANGEVHKRHREPSQHHTSSIDAKLPGEDDGYWDVSGPLNPGFWSAIFQPRCAGNKFASKAATEAMARRAAYLKSRLAMEERDDG